MWNAANSLPNKTAITAASVFNSKAKLWVKGRKNTFEYIENSISKSDRIIWVHAASLGEFEQGRPIIEAIKKNHQEYKIILTYLCYLCLFNRSFHGQVITRLPPYVVPIRWSKQLLELATRGSSMMVLRKESNFLLKTRTEDEVMSLIFFGRQLKSLQDLCLKLLHRI